MTMPTGAPPAPLIDPATGLPVAPTIDPATGLPVGQQPPPPPAYTPPPVPPITVQTPPPPPPPPGDDMIPRATVQQMIDAERERVRQEEKDKLYPELQSQREQLQALNADLESRRRAEADAEAQRLEAERLAAEADQTALQRLDQYRSEQDQRFAAIEAERDQERALREREVEFSRLQQFRATRLAEEAADIMPQFADYVTGGTEEAINQSIELAKQKTAQVVAEVQGVQQQQRQQIPFPVSGQPPVDMQGTSGGGGERQLTAQEIRDMPIEEYGAMRPQLLAAGSQRVREHDVCPLIG